MNKQNLLHVDVRILEPVQVAYRECTFREGKGDCASRIHRTFQYLREWAVCMGLNPAELLQIGIPTLHDGALAGYACCLEYMLPYLDEHSEVSIMVLPGGRYAVMPLEKTLEQAGEILALLHSGYDLSEHQIVPDPHRPVYEIFHPHSTDYCVPVAE